MKFKIYLIAFYKAFISPSKPKKSYSQYAEDLIIQSFFSRKLKTGRYVDIVFVTDRNKN